MKKIILFLLLAGSIFAQTTIEPGQIAFIGFHADNQDGFTFILLRDLDANTVIYFTSAGWDGSNSTWYNDYEGHYSWTVPSGGLPFGTIVYIAETATGDVLSASSGTISALLYGSGGWAVSSSGDQILAYQSSTGVRPASPNFIAAVDADYYSSYDGTDGWTTSYNVNTIGYASYLPPGLINGVSCVALANASQTTEYDNFIYTGTLTGTASDVRSAINLYSNWTGNNSPIDISVTAFPTPNLTDPLPVELISFSAAIKENSVELNWQTATEVNNYGFEVQQSAVSSQNSDPASHDKSGYAATTWTKIGFVEGTGNSNSPKEYTYIDNSKLDGKYQYRLKQIDIDGNYEYSEIVEVEINSLPNKFSLSQNYPNPFNPATVIRYSIPVAALSVTPSGGQAVEAQHVSLIVYDILGNEVTTLVNENQPAGNYEVTFNASGLASSVYLYKLQTSNGFVSTKKLVLLR